MDKFYSPCKSAAMCQMTGKYSSMCAAICNEYQPKGDTMTKPLIFEGYSDDTFGEHGRTDTDYDNCGNGEPIVFAVSHESDELTVWGQYAPQEIDAGTWVIGCAPTNSEMWPDWNIRYRAVGNSYSPALVINAPLGCVVRRIFPKTNKE